MLKLKENLVKKSIPDTIKVFTIIDMKLERVNNLSDDSDFITKRACSVKNLPANLSMESYMKAVKKFMDHLSLYFVPWIYKFNCWHQFTVYLELSKDDGEKIFDYEFPFAVDDEWYTDLGGIYEQAQVRISKLKETEG